MASPATELHMSRQSWLGTVTTHGRGSDSGNSLQHAGPGRPRERPVGCRSSGNNLGRFRTSVEILGREFRRTQPQAGRDRGTQARQPTDSEKVLCCSGPRGARAWAQACRVSPVCGALSFSLSLSRWLRLDLGPRGFHRWQDVDVPTRQEPGSLVLQAQLAGSGPSAHRALRIWSKASLWLRRGFWPHFPGDPEGLGNKDAHFTEGNVSHQAVNVRARVSSSVLTAP